MPTSPRPITWYRLGSECTSRFTKQAGYAAYIIDESGVNVLKITLMERVNLRLSEFKRSRLLEPFKGGLTV